MRMSRTNFNNEANCTLEEVAEALGVTRQRADQIQRQALAKCRRVLEARGMCLADLIPGIELIGNSRTTGVGQSAWRRDGET